MPSIVPLSARNSDWPTFFSTEVKITSAWAGSVAAKIVGLVAVDADGELARVLDRLQRADAGGAGDREDHVGALVELGQRHFLALGRVGEACRRRH